MLRKRQHDTYKFTVEGMRPTNPTYILFLYVISGILKTDGLDKDRRWGKLSKKEFPQVWFKYVHKVMQIVLLKIFSYDPLDCISKVLSTKMKSSKKFLAYARYILQNSQYASKVSKASGRITLQMNGSIMKTDASRFESFKNYIWIFSTHKSLALNITVENIQFATDYLQCNWGRLTILSFKSLGIPFTFCGHQTSFNIYPSYSDVNIVIYSYMYSIFIFSASHTIITKSQIVGISTSNLKSSWIYFVKKGTVLYTFHIKVRKIHNIVVQSTETLFYRYDIYDGPGFLSTNLRNSRDIYETSTFQCVVQMLTKPLQLTVDGYFNYTSKRINISHIFKISSNDNSTIMNLPMNTCFRQLCAVYLFTEETVYINITLLKMIYKGPTEEKCKYGGLITGEEMMNDYKESETVCESHSGEKHNSLTFFSKKSSLILLVYWYEQYSEIHTTTVMSLTKCTAIQLNACAVQNFCNPIFSRWSNLSKCESYIKDISDSHLIYPGKRHLSYQKDFLYHDIYGLYEFVFFSLNDEECIVIQFRERTVSLGDIFEPRCKIQLRSRNVLQQGKKLQYKLKGSLHSFSHNFRDIKVKFKFIPDYLAFYGITEKFCLKISAEEPENCRLTQKQKSEATVCKGDSFFRMSQNFFEKKDFYILASQSFSVASNLMRIKVQLNLFSKSWMDVIISEHNMIENVGVTLKESVSLPFKLHNLKNIGYRWTHFILLKLDERLTNSDSIMFNVKLKSCLEGPHNRAKLRWSSGFKFSHLRDFKLISLPGRIYEATLQMGSMLFHGNEHLKNNSLHLIWLHESVEYSHISVVLNKNCSKLSVTKNAQVRALWFWFWTCLSDSSLPSYVRLAKCPMSIMNHYSFNILSVKCDNYKLTRGSNDLHYMIISNIPDNMGNKFSANKLSWMEASKLCKNAGGLLPYFTSRWDLDQLILFVKLSRHGFPMEGLFIGLVHSPNINKVIHLQY